MEAIRAIAYLAGALVGIVVVIVGTIVQIIIAIVKTIIFTVTLPRRIAMFMRRLAFWKTAH